jgi:hypothetical protein
MSWWPEEVLDTDRLRGLVESVLDRIHRAHEGGRFPHALLLSGPPGLGRELAAVEAAVMLTCDDAPRPFDETPCARRVRTGRHPDVVAVLPQGASAKIKIEQIREVVDSAPARPYEGNRRVWILDGVEVGRLVPAAANAFLKVLEEPPDHVRFVLLASNPSAVLATIRSRCQQLSLPGPAAVARRLGLDTPVGLSRWAVDGVDLESAVAEVGGVLGSAMRGEVRGLLTTPQLVPEGIPGTEFVAAVALVQAAAMTDGDDRAELARLASDLTAVERMVGAVGLTRDRQLVSTLLRWFEDLPRTG